MQGLQSTGSLMKREVTETCDFCDASFFSFLYLRIFPHSSMSWWSNYALRIEAFMDFPLLVGIEGFRLNLVCSYRTTEEEKQHIAKSTSCLSLISLCSFFCHEYPWVNLKKIHVHSWDFTLSWGISSVNLGGNWSFVHVAVWSFTAQAWGIRMDPNFPTYINWFYGHAVYNKLNILFVASE